MLKILCSVTFDALHTLSSFKDNAERWISCSFRSVCLCAGRKCGFPIVQLHIQFLPISLLRLGVQLLNRELERGMTDYFPVAGMQGHSESLVETMTRFWLLLGWALSWTGCLVLFVTILTSAGEESEGLNNHCALYWVVRNKMLWFYKAWSWVVWDGTECYLCHPSDFFGNFRKFSKGRYFSKMESLHLTMKKDRSNVLHSHWN